MSFIPLFLYSFIPPRGSRYGEVRWKSPDYTDLIRILRNPTYAGAYAYGKFHYDSFDRSPTNGKAKVDPRPMKSWPSFPAELGIHDRQSARRIKRQKKMPYTV